MSVAVSLSRFPWKIGVSRRVITPPPHVELAGLGYYLNRTATRVQDDLHATALVIEDVQGQSAAVVTLDLMYCSETLTRTIRDLVSTQTPLPSDSICVCCTHSHNAPTAGFIRGAGDIDLPYIKQVGQKAAEALVQAWRERRPASLRVGHIEVNDLTMNRTREGGPVDKTLSVLRADSAEGKPLAVAFNFHSHLTAHFEINMDAVSRDWPGEVQDQIEAALPGALALYLQGTCGDVNLRPEYNNTERRFEPARLITTKLQEALESSRPVNGDTVSAVTRQVFLPTRRWTGEEIMRDRQEALHRLQTGDTEGWLKGFARVIVGVPERLPLRYGGSVAKAVAAASRFMVEWSDIALRDLDTRPEQLATEVQALRIGDVWIAAHSSELFTTLGLALRERWPGRELFILGYANGGIGYLPDAYEIARGGYAACQSPKFTNQFPFTPAAGEAMIQGLLDTLKLTATASQ